MVKAELSDLRMQTSVIGQKQIGELSYIVSEFAIFFSRFTYIGNINNEVGLRNRSHISKEGRYVPRQALDPPLRLSSELYS